jgi:microcompartment protein CcmK/EutM
MKLTKVVGTVVATQKQPKLEGHKLLVVEDVDTNGKPKGTYVVAVDTVGAGIGEVVLTVAGSSARMTEATRDCPVDATIVGIVETVELQGKVTFKKEGQAR